MKIYKQLTMRILYTYRTVSKKFWSTVTSHRTPNKSKLFIINKLISLDL